MKSFLGNTIGVLSAGDLAERGKVLVGGEGLEDGRGRGQEEDGAAALLAGPGEGADHLAAGLAEDGGAALGGQGDGLVKDNGKVIDAGGGDGTGYHSKTQGGGPVFVGEPERVPGPRGGTGGPVREFGRRALVPGQAEAGSRSGGRRLGCRCRRGRAVPNSG